MFGPKYKEQKFNVLLTLDGYAVKQLGRQTRASITLKGKMDSQIANAFRLLTEYILGASRMRITGQEKGTEAGNTAPAASSPAKGNQKMPMTVPIAIQQQGQMEKASTIMSFVLPNTFKDAKEVPVPTDERIQIEVVPSRDMAVISCSKNFTEERFWKKVEYLRHIAARDSIQLSTDPNDVELWIYNSPWTLPWLKKNEVAIRVVDVMGA
ncbi:SOUL hem-binding protein, partial [Dunaliella salina]